ncbi:hypothetical protein ACFWPA_15450 [Rhodococcus sp. NPDC058505]|uniref:hypothetical protein n=1 Tax=Rhodococcus sp. NPDC058505 TaxID=3346531 RepID=UPI0036554817
MSIRTTALTVSVLAAAAVVVSAGTAHAAGTTMPADSTYIVGVDIEPGLYVSPGPIDGDYNCWGTRLSGFTGEGDDVIAYAYGTGRVVVDITPTDAAFRSLNCLPWTRIGDSPSAAPVQAPDLTAPVAGAAAIGSAVVGSAVLPALVPLLAAGSTGL